ncbi:MAG TPA: CHAT domain-containing protein [Acidimicrobiales bacterium]|nr:CHAT domain-containing protein [Acidimicrobiales bacterium]
MADLRAGQSVQVSGARVSSATARGEVIPGIVLEGSSRSTLLGALDSLGLRQDRVLGLEVERLEPPTTGGEPSRSATTAAALGAANVVVEVPPPPPGQGQVLLVEEGGVISWVLPHGDTGAGTGPPAAADVTRFLVPVGPPLDGDGPGQRGLVRKPVRRILHVLTFDLIDKVAGEVGDHFVSRWEEGRRPHRLRSFTKADYRVPGVPSLDAMSLRALGQAPALLLIHGTNSLSHSGFASLSPDTVDGFHTRYGGRVFAFDHPTLSVSPLDNAKAFAQLLPGDVSLDVDVLCHSRGGLVARVLAELGEHAGVAGRLRVRQVVFVATPNLGTPLADPANLGKLLDGLTNLLDVSSDRAATDSLAGIVAAVRQLAVGAPEGLDGLTSMNPRLSDNPFLTMLNVERQHGTRYRAVAADYEPPPGTPRARWLRDAAVDMVFGWEPNDLIVPTASAYSWNGAQNFPIVERIVLPSERAVDHSSFWTAPEAVTAFTAWLSADDAVLAPERAVGPVRLVRSADDPLADVDERFAAGDLEGVREAVRALPEAERARLRSEVGDLPLDAFVSRGLETPKAGVVFVLPGIMGSNLWVDEGGGDRDRVWLNPLRLMKGDFARLRLAGGGEKIEAGGLYRAYLPLVMALDASWEVVPAGYDWRLPLEAAADSLAARIERRSGGQPMPAHLVCHSMGGLVARMLMARHPDLWNAVDSPDDRAKGGRLVMLGTPTLGSFAIALALTGDDHLVQWLARIDIPNDRDQIVAILRSFPGAYQLLTSPRVAVAGSHHDKLYDAASWQSSTIVADHLAAAGESHRVLAERGLDPERMFYVAGAGHATPAAVKVDGGRFTYRMTAAGDGRVTHELGLPHDASGEPVFGDDKVWFSPASHGDLPKDAGVVAAVGDILHRGTTSQLAATPPPRGRGSAVAEDRWIPAALVEPPIPSEPAARGSAPARWPAGSRAELRAEARAATDRAVEAWLGTSAKVDAVPVLAMGVLHASLEYSTYHVMVGHYRGLPIAGAEGYLDRKLDRTLTARQAAGRYPEALGEILRVPSEGRPPGALVLGLGAQGELTPTGLASAARHAALEHALAWLDDPCRVGDGNIGLSTCLIGSHGVAGLTLASSIAAIVEGVVLANLELASRAGDPVRIATLELVERYAGAAEEAAHVVRDIAAYLPGAVRDAVELRPDQCLRPGEGKRPAVPTADYDAGQWHRIVVRSGVADGDGRMKLQFTSLGVRARADDLAQDVDTLLLRRMLEEAVVHPTVDGRVNTALFELLFPNEIKRELAGVENIHLVLDPAAADFPWEALADRGGLTGDGPVALRGGFLRQLTTPPQRQLEPLSGVPGALVIGDPPGGEPFERLDGARKEASEVAELLAREGGLAVESLIYPAETPTTVDSASQVLSALLANDYRIVHIAAHGHFERRPSGPPLGGVVIGPNAYLTASSLRSMRRPPDVVFLNCCHLGSLSAATIDAAQAPSPAAAEAAQVVEARAFTRKKLNELAASLAHELTLMGVRAVVVAGWAVSDTPAADFARAFYSQMLQGALFGDAVRVARDIAFASDGGSSNTWAAYQCYGDPSFRLGQEDSDAAVLVPPVSADEMQRRLEEIEVDARNADDAYRAVLSQRVRAQYDLAEREWPRKSRMWTAFGWAHATLGEVEPAVKAYRRALHRKDALAPLRAVEELADLEHRLFVDLTAKGATKAELLAASGEAAEPCSPEALREESWRRLDALDDVVGPSTDRHALRARMHEREARLRTQGGDGAARLQALSAAGAEYVKAWELSADEVASRDPSFAVRTCQLVGVGAEVPAPVLGELQRFLDTWQSSGPTDDFESRVLVADRHLAAALASPAGDAGPTLADVTVAYHRVFAERSAPDQRAKVVAGIAALAALDPSREDGLHQLIDQLTSWTPRR